MHSPHLYMGKGSQKIYHETLSIKY